MVFTFDATGMRGKTLVIYEHIYYHKTTTSYLDYEVGKHTELKDEAQMIHIPEIGTTAWDSETRQHITKADDDATIIDTVAYKNLYPGLEYTLDASLIDLDTGGEVAVDDYGVEIKGTATFVPKDWEGTVDVRFDNYEITSLAGHTLVAFEYLYYKGTLIEHHDNPEDGAQTIHIPRIATHASNFESDSGNANAEAYVNVVDEIEYWNLVPGLEYTAVGIIINKETGSLQGMQRANISKARQHSPLILQMARQRLYLPLMQRGWRKQTLLYLRRYSIKGTYMKEKVLQNTAI